VDSVRLVSGVTPPPPPPPDPVPPVYSQLKDLHLITALVEDGKPTVTIVAPASGIYQTPATDIQQSVRKLTGVQIPVVNDRGALAAVPIDANLIVLGNRSTNRTISALYDLYYSLLDLKYPGLNGYVVRTLHNPFGNGHNVIFVGGSDSAGVTAGTNALITKLEAIGAAQGRLALGRTAEIKLGKGVEVPTDLRQFETWEASDMYGSSGYFGWNSISKRMAMHYMTGDPFHAREVVRLAFPDAQAIKEIDQIDGERIENKKEPLRGPYHYNAHMMVLFWDLIEESPAFTDAERLRITNAFSTQLAKRSPEGIYRITTPLAHVGSRHGQWSAVSLYCLGRYFQTYYPDPIWDQCVRGAKLHFASLSEHAWIYGESDNLFWYNTGIAPILTHTVLTGDRKPVDSGALQTLLRGQEMLLSGKPKDRNLHGASLGFLHKAAHVTGDGRWIHYRQRTQLDTDIFRLGQSFWPSERLKPTPPEDLVGKWSVNPLPKPLWRTRGSGIPLNRSFLFGSFRSAPDASGDFILLDGYNGASRNPYHTFSILELRLDGATLLKGYRNQVLTKADGMVEPKVAMDAGLLCRDVIGQTVVAVAEVPKAAFSSWRRALIQRLGRYALIVDDLTFRTDSDNMQVEFSWETAGGTWDSKSDAIIIQGDKQSPYELRTADPLDVRGRGVIRMFWNGAVNKDQHGMFFHLLRRRPDDSQQVPACTRIAENAAVLGLPLPALAVVGEHDGVKADLALVATDHLHGRRLAAAALDGAALLSADPPVNVDWDFSSGRLRVVAPEDTQIRLAIGQGPLTVDGAGVKHEPGPDGQTVLRLRAGRHTMEGAKPHPQILSRTTGHLRSLLAHSKEQRLQATAAASSTQAGPVVPELPVAMTVKVTPSKIVHLSTIPLGKGSLICAVAGKTAHLLTAEGKSVRTLQADADIRMAHWWPEHKLLLTGCVDEKVIAFGEDGERKWEFVSEMDPAVYAAAKTYWFKSARGHGGIHGLSTGIFLDGTSQCFVGSACTLEIIDENGLIVKRKPVFWGPGWKFALTNGPDASTNLLIARQPTDSHALAVLNNKTMKLGRSFHGVPSGHTSVSGWACMSRGHIFYQDLDGDGTQEVVSEINGRWNRVTVWDEAGRPLHNAQFGPGATIPNKNMRDLDVADLDGDGKKEIVVGTSAGLVVALDHTCERLWSRRLASSPLVLGCYRPAGATEPWVVVGCHDGTVLALDGAGKTVREASVTGSPTGIDSIETPAGMMVLIASSKGEVRGLRLTAD
ncbi:MAG: hypothetical protein HN406_33865, partial [Lentisphaerae bacterium]|nr:hypothetical protein [Lentisphaerota bacterium]